ncbi:MAG: hypothetical protein D0528_08880 [Methylococcales bacterium]|nr:MAG: hypothetical protein D0528_08880 [Methylococcales bacterium]
MKILLRFVLFLSGLCLLLCALFVFFGVSDQPDIAVGWKLTHDDVVRAQKILHEGAKTKPDDIGSIELTQPDLNLAANYLLNRYSKSAVNIELRSHVLRFTVTTTLPKNSFGEYLNISFRLGNDNPNELPTLTKFKAGKLLLPAKLAGFVIDTIIQNTSLKNYVILATRPIKTITIDPEKLSISYYSSMDTMIQARNFLTDGTENPDLDIYQKKLAEIIAQHNPNWRLSLADLLKPLFELALQRSTLENAIEENKLAIIAVNNYVNRKETKKFFSFPASNLTDQTRYPTFLYKRIDLAQHFIGSAAITASVNGQIAKVVGEEKELSDANGGSGFSFIDLAADKAGTKLGEIATSSPENARKIQQAMANIKDYSDFMPDPTDLPEHMNDAEFKQRYQSIDSLVYQALSNQIDARIAAIPLYHQD